MVLPSGDEATEYAIWLTGIVYRRCCEARSHTAAAPLSLAATSDLPSGENASAYPKPLSTARRRPLISQRSIVPSAAPVVANDLPSGENARPKYHDLFAVASAMISRPSAGSHSFAPSFPKDARVF